MSSQALHDGDRLNRAMSRISKGCLRGWTMTSIFSKISKFIKTSRYFSIPSGPLSEERDYRSEEYRNEPGSWLINDKLELTVKADGTKGAWGRKPRPAFKRESYIFKTQKSVRHAFRS